MVSVALLASARAADPAPEPVSASESRGATDVKIPISLLFGRTEIGQPTARLTEGGQLIGFDGPEIIEMLRPILLPKHVDRLRGLQGVDGFLPVSDLVKVGIGAEYSSSELALRVTIPYEMRTAAAISIAGRTAPVENVKRVAPASVSAYLNVRAASEYKSRGGAATEEDGRQPSVVNFDGATEILGAALEGSGTYREALTDPWRRGDVRLVKDFPEDRNRLTVGDLNNTTTGFQSFRSAGGIAFARNSNLQPYRSTTSTAERTFTLDQRSQVDVLVNGRRVRTLDLEPGRYNLRDLPLANGTNNVSIRIIDEVGRVETISFPFVFDTNLLAAGEQEFSYAVGARSRATPTGKDYDRQDPVFTASHVVGVTDDVTLGANVQAVERHQVVGVEGRVGTVVGIFRGDVSVSESPYAPSDVAARLQYRWSETSGEESLDRNLLGNVTYRGKSFLSAGETEPANPTSVDAGISYGQRLPFDWTGSVGYSQQFDSGGSPESQSVDFGLSRRLTETVFFDVFGRHQEQRDSEDQSSILFTVSWIPFESHQRVSVQHDTLDRTQRLDWSYSPPDLIGGVQATINAERSLERDEDRVRGDLNYTDYRFEAQLSNDETYGGDSTSARRTTGLRFATALAFADGKFAISRPISDSFAMVVPHASLSGTDLEVNRSGNSAQARADGFGPAVLPRLPSYYTQRVVVDVDELPDGYDLGDQLFNVQPRYRSGTLIEVGTGATAMIEGVLVDDGGRPIDLRLGTVVSLDAPESEPKPFFTNATGLFQLLGLVPGRYQIRLDAAPDAFVAFEVPADATGVVSIGTLKFPTDSAP